MPPLPSGETRFQRHLFTWCALGVVIVCAACVLRTWQVGGTGALAELGGYATTSLVLLGKFVIFIGLHEDCALGPWQLALLVWLIDLVVAILLAGGLGGLEQSRLFGRWLRRARERALQVLREYPGLGRMAFFGVVAFVMLPLAATGAVSGSFAARLVGLTRAGGFFAIAIGSAGTAFTFALLAQFVGERAEELARSPALLGLSIVALLVIGRFAYLRITKRLRS